jgi:ABC-type uncharacterized transport system permease subunit
LTHALGSRFRGKKPGLKTIAAASGLALGWVASVRFNHEGFFFGHLLEKLKWHQWITILSISVLGTALGYIIYELIWRYHPSAHNRKSPPAKSRP